LSWEFREDQPAVFDQHWEETRCEKRNEVLLNFADLGQCATEDGSERIYVARLRQGDVSKFVTEDNADAIRFSVAA
jgi:hypothetical protein